MTRQPTRVPSLDLQAALERFGGNPELLLQIIDMFRAEAGRLGSAIRTALDANDLRAVAHSAHNLCGMALNLDAAPTVAAARAVEHAADAEAVDALRAKVGILETELARLCNDLENVTLPAP